MSSLEHDNLAIYIPFLPLDQVLSIITSPHERVLNTESTPVNSSFGSAHSFASENIQWPCYDELHQPGQQLASALKLFASLLNGDF